MRKVIYNCKNTQTSHTDCQGLILMYEHKTYETEMLKSTHDFITKITKDWENWQYPSYENLKANYETRPNFTPETRHYAYKEGKMVGFLASAKEREIEGKSYGSIQRPFVLDDNPEIEKFLVEKAVTTLKEKGVEIIRTNYRKGWGDPEFMKRNKYSDGKVVAKSGVIPFKSFDMSGFSNEYEVRELDLVEDKIPLIRAFTTEMTQTEEEIGTIIDSWKETDAILSNAIVRQGDEIISHSMVYQNPNNKTAAMTHISIYKEGKEDLRKQVFKYIVKRMQGTDREVLNFNIGQDFFDLVPFYESKGVVFEDLNQYELSI